MNDEHIRDCARLAELMGVVPEYDMGWHTHVYFPKTGDYAAWEWTWTYEHVKKYHEHEACVHIPPLGWLVRELDKTEDFAFLSRDDASLPPYDIVWKAWFRDRTEDELDYVQAPTPEGAVVKALIAILEDKENG